MFYFKAAKIIAFASLVLATSSCALMETEESMCKKDLIANGYAPQKELQDEIDVSEINSGYIIDSESNGEPVIYVHCKPPSQHLLRVHQLMEVLRFRAQ